MELREWIVGEHASVRGRFEKSIVDVVPTDRWRDGVGAGGSSIAYLLYHVSYHEDLAVNAVLRGDEPMMGEWCARLGLDSFESHAGLGEAEDAELVAAVDLDSLLDYAGAVHDATAAWLADTDLAVLDATPAAGAGLERAGVAEAVVPWLHAMWSGKPSSFFVQWEAIGHRINHVGEMVSVRNRLGLSPF